MAQKGNVQYKESAIHVLGNTYSVLVASGSMNYVSIRKETNNPFKIAGRQFENFNHAVASYRSPDMKAALLKCELGLPSTTNAITGN